jgi:lysyl-tRNA synthetase class 2
MNLSEQEMVRRESLQKLRELGINPYPSEQFVMSLEGRDKEVTTIEAIRHFERVEAVGENVPIKLTIAGRLMMRNIMGKASFCKIQDHAGQLQVYVMRDEICPGEDKELYNTVFKKLLDLGDHIGFVGTMFRTQTGEVSLKAIEMVLLSKSLKPLPIVKRDEEGNEHGAFTSQEARYRQRYVDLIVNPDVKVVFRKRAQIVNAIRESLIATNFLEVETPILQPIHGGAAARPFITHHNKLDMDLYLRIANELYLKRLIVGGFPRVFEFAKDFRNEGMSRFHNPEFTQVELYAAYKDYMWMMDICERLIQNVAEKVGGGKTYGPNEVNFNFKFERETFAGAIASRTGRFIYNMSTDDIREMCKEHGIHVDVSMGRGKLLDELFGEIVEPTLIQPTFIYDYPIEMSPLAKENMRPIETGGGLVYGNGTAERFELFINGKEIANAYSEQNDPIVQRERFEEQLRLAGAGDDEAMALDEDFLRALEYGMPPTAGLGIGIDRLVMILTEQNSIQDVLLFPQMRAENKVESKTEENAK